MSEHVFDKKRWQSMGLFWQMGNIGSEVGRALKAKSVNNEKNMTGAFYRGLDLIDATVEQMISDKSPRAKEVLRARENFVQSITTDTVDDKLEEYFMQFAMAERLNR